MRRITIITCAFFMLVALHAKAQQASDSPGRQNSVFPKGERAPSDHFTGTVWVHRFVDGSDQLDCIVANYVFLFFEHSNKL